MPLTIAVGGVLRFKDYIIKFIRTADNASDRPIGVKMIVSDSSICFENQNE